MSHLELLRNWVVLNKGLKDLTERQVLDLIEFEQDGKHRSDVLLRLHQRYTTLRAIRERKSL